MGQANRLPHSCSAAATCVAASVILPTFGPQPENLPACGPARRDVGTAHAGLPLERCEAYTFGAFLPASSLRKHKAALQKPLASTALQCHKFARCTKG